MYQKREQDSNNKNKIIINNNNNNNNKNINYFHHININHKRITNINDLKIGKFIKKIQNNKILKNFEESKTKFKRIILNYKVDNKFNNDNKEKDRNNNKNTKEENFSLKDYYEKFITNKSLNNLKKLCFYRKPEEENSKILNELFKKYQIFKELQEQIIRKIFENNKKLLKIYKYFFDYIGRDLISKLNLYMKYLKFYFLNEFKEKIKKFNRDNY
jgi:hypothetical protein